MARGEGRSGGWLWGGGGARKVVRIGARTNGAATYKDGQSRLSSMCDTLLSDNTVVAASRSGAFGRLACMMDRIFIRRMSMISCSSVRISSEFGMSPSALDRRATREAAVQPPPFPGPAHQSSSSWATTEKCSGIGLKALLSCRSSCFAASRAAARAGNGPHQPAHSGRAAAPGAPAQRRCCCEPILSQSGAMILHRRHCFSTIASHSGTETRCCG